MSSLVARFGFAFLSVLVLSRCSPEIRRGILSSVFDGVPNDQIVQADSLADSTGATATMDWGLAGPKPFKLHSPYLERACEGCHDVDGGNTLSEPTPALCYLCHVDYAEQYAVVHGPVAAGYCTKCHDPHRSRNDYLLKLDGQQLCLQCHEKSDVMENEEHYDLGDDNCLDCHDPHGGDDASMI